MSKRTITRIISEEKDRGSLFYDQYEWSVSWRQPEVSVLRNSLEELQVEKAIANARYWEHQRWKNRWSFSATRTVVQEGDFHSAITKKVVQDIHALRALLVDKPHRRTLNVGGITVYTSDAVFKDQLLEFAQQHSTAVVRRANVIYPANAVVVKNPKNKYRTYLRSREVSDENIKILQNWLDAQQGEIVASPGMNHFFKHRKSGYYYPTNYTADYHYFDHDDMRYVTMLRMVLPVAIRKTVPIVAK